MDKRITLIPVEPVAVRKSLAFIRTTGGGGGARMLDVKEYPPSPNGERMRRERLAAGMTMWGAAHFLRVTPADISGLESGRCQLSEEGWGIVWGMLNEKGRQ